MDRPLVSVIIPVYNAAKYLPASIESAIRQTWANIEIIVVDDGSTDDSLSIAKAYESNNLKVISQPNGGASKARNQGLQKAHGEYIQFLDADDILSADKIEVQVMDLMQHQGCVSITNTINFYDDESFADKKPLKEWFNEANVIAPVDFLLKLYGGDKVSGICGGMIQPNAWLTPRKVIDKAGFWNEDLTVDDDGDFFCRVLLHSKGVKFNANGINYYRKFKSSGSLSSNRSEKSFNSRLNSTDLKYRHLQAHLTPELLNSVFARYYWEIGVDAYPAYKALSKQAINEAKKLKYNGPKYTSGKLATAVSKVLGWKIVKFVSYYIHRNPQGEPFF